MTPHFLFPASPLNPRVIDEAFVDQAAALKAAGFSTSVVDIDGGYIRPKLEPSVVCVYRGWMMNPEEYMHLAATAVTNHGELLTSPEQYLATHHFPNWYPLLEKHTPHSVVFSNQSFGEPYPLDDDLNQIAAQLQAFVRSKQEWGKFQLKDYVKSLKTGGGSTFTTPEEILPILEAMRKYRGTIEGGIVLRQWEEFVAGSEKRYFVINGRYYSQDFGFDLRHMRILARVHDVVPSPFYSVDIAQPKNTDLEARLVEIGDGQVSDLVGWTPERFAGIWKEAYA